MTDMFVWKKKRKENIALAPANTVHVNLKNVVFMCDTILLKRKTEALAVDP